jgi:hypothetical protein
MQDTGATGERGDDHQLSREVEGQEKEGRREFLLPFVFAGAPLFLDTPGHISDILRFQIDRRKLLSLPYTNFSSSG